MLDKTGFPISHCGAGINAISINPNGDVFPCVKVCTKEKKITNIFDEGAIKHIKENRLQILNNDLIFQKSECSKCEIKYFCGGGCQAEEKNQAICKYNCDYFKLAIKFYCEKLGERKS